MKKFATSIFLVLFVLTSFQLFAEKVGTINAIYTYPAAFKADQQVTFYFDLTGTGLAGLDNLHLYSWIPKEIEAWNSPSNRTKLTKDANNSSLYTLTCIPTDLWGTTVADFGLQIFGLIKTEDGSKQTEDFSEGNGNAFKLFDYTQLQSKIAVVWPAGFVYEKPISIVVNIATAWSNNGTSQGQLIGENVFIWLGANSWNPGSKYNTLGDPNAKCDAVSGETNVAQYNFWPETTFSPPAITIKELDFLFNNGTWDKTARDVAGGDFKFKPDLGAAKSGAFTPFPGKVTQQDLISIIYKPSLDTLGTGLQQGVLTGSDRIYVYMVFETATGNVTPIAQADVNKTPKLLMKTMPDGTYKLSFILDQLFTQTELPTGLEIKKLHYRFINFDGIVSPFLTLDPFKLDVSKSDN